MTRWAHRHLPPRCVSVCGAHSAGRAGPSYGLPGQPARPRSATPCGPNLLSLSGAFVLRAAMYFYSGVDTSTQRRHSSSLMRTSAIGSQSRHNHAEICEQIFVHRRKKFDFRLSYPQADEGRSDSLGRLIANCRHPHCWA